MRREEFLIKSVVYFYAGNKAENSLRQRYETTRIQNSEIGKFIYAEMKLALECTEGREQK